MTGCGTLEVRLKSFTASIAVTGKVIVIPVRTLPVRVPELPTVPPLWINSAPSRIYPAAA
jgi:hypothetical protein